MAHFEQVTLKDGTLIYNNTLNAAGATAAIDTTGYGNIIFQVDCEYLFQGNIEGSNDGLDWFPLIINPLNDFAVTDLISAEGLYQVKSTSLYIRFNLAYTGGPVELIVIGRSGDGENAGDNIAAAFNPDTPIQVAFGNGVKQDRNGALILSDGIPYYLIGPNAYVINLDGYSTISLQLTGAVTVTATQSIDGVSWSSCYFGNNSTAILTNIPNAAGIWTGPVVGKFLRVVLSGAVATALSASIVLKSTAMNGNYWNLGVNPVNVGQVGGTTTVTGGVAGILAVGGNIAAGVAPTANPVLAGGIDTGGLTKRLLTDVPGRILANVTSIGMATIGSQLITNGNAPTSNIAHPQNTLGVLPATYQQSAALNVQDTMTADGLNKPELLSLILLELRILNQQIYELPRTLGATTYGDPPDFHRQEPSTFNQ